MTKPAPANRADIMTVDDNPANLKLLEGMLCKQGYRVRSFPLGRLALAAAEANPPDLILLDVNMPEMTGYEVCQRLKRSEKLSRIPVIFLSALQETEDKVTAFGAGAVDFVTKPFQFEEVQARVETHLELWRLRQVLELHNASLEEVVRLRTRELAAAHARLKILDETKNDFLNLISHELRTPLNGLLGVGELLLAESCGNPDGGELRSLFEESRGRILNLLDDALLLTQIEVAAEKFMATPIALSAVLSRALEGVSELAGSRQVTIRPAPANAALVLGEEMLLVKALQALLETAVRFCKPGEIVQLACEAAPDAATVIIETPGGTIPVPVIANFFDLLAVSEAATTGGDLGLGPPVASRIVSLFGGSLKVENRNPSGIRLLARLNPAKAEYVPGLVEG